LAVGIFRVRLATQNALRICFKVTEGLLRWWGVELDITGERYVLVNLFKVLQQGPAQPGRVVTVVAAIYLSGASISSYVFPSLG